MHNRRRYSRWAVAAAALGLFGLANYAAVIAGWLDFMSRLQSQAMRMGVSRHAVEFGVVLSAVLFGPFYVVAGNFALCQVRADSRLRGALLARSVVMFGWVFTIGTVSLIGAAAIAAWSDPR